KIVPAAVLAKGPCGLRFGSHPFIGPCTMLLRNLANRRVADLQSAQLVQSLRRDVVRPTRCGQTDQPLSLPRIAPVDSQTIIQGIAAIQTPRTLEVDSRQTHLAGDRGEDAGLTAPMPPVHSAAGPTRRPFFSTSAA